jgi:hypothetical protein
LTFSTKVLFWEIIPTFVEVIKKHRNYEV